ncbi:sensor histidine kinase [Chengkuizengella axinellae]
MVVITDDQFVLLEASDDVTEEIEHFISKSKILDLTLQGELIESRWRTEPYLTTISPIIIDNRLNGYVFMFLKTQPIRDMIQNLTMQFFIVGAIAVVISIVTTIFLSKFITGPLIQMKIATEKLSKGKSDVILDTFREDELGDLSRSIQKLSNDLKRLKKERSEFLSSISHELRTPLTYIKGYADVLKRPSLALKEKEDYISIIQEETENVTNLVNDLFDLAKMDRNEFLIKKEVVECCEYFQEIITIFKPAYEEKNVMLNFSCVPKIFVNIDRTRFGQVVHNFLDNALKYSPSNSNVQLKVQMENQQVRIRISDEGEGIPKTDLPRIWDRLYRVDKSRSRTTGGSGLGLTIAKEIIERHGGSVHVESTISKCTIFSIYIPLERL